MNDPARDELHDHTVVAAHIICVDDDEAILHVLRQQLAPFEETHEIDLATSGQEALDLLVDLDRDREAVALVIADQIMPGMKGVQLLQQIHKTHPETSKILLTGQAGLDAVVHAINHAGLNRYISKPWDEPDLRLTVESLLSRYQLACDNAHLIECLRRKNDELSFLNRDLEARVDARTRELVEANERLVRLAITDGLTGKYNHRYFHERVALEVERSRRSGSPLSLLMIDVDFFKRFNDTHGHLAGDGALKRVAALISEDRRVNDIVARYGGEEFAVLLLDTSPGAAEMVAEQMRERIANSGEAEFVGERLTISIGVAACPEHALEGEALVDVADQALYRAKDLGRDRVELAQVKLA
ncbi:MAG: diguanylate cyclase [Deltaproteobacteria bacterium]|nr:diguanylate cyclase [Deltaproteobacteria bacterium]